MVMTVPTLCWHNREDLNVSKASKTSYHAGGIVMRVPLTLQWYQQCEYYTMIEAFYISRGILMRFSDSQE